MMFDADGFSKLPISLQWATIIGTMIVVVALGLNKFWRSRQAPEPRAPYREIDPFQLALSTAERIERGIHERLDRIDRALADINKDTIETRRNTNSCGTNFGRQT